MIVVGSVVLTTWGLIAALRGREASPGRLTFRDTSLAYQCELPKPGVSVRDALARFTFKNVGGTRVKVLGVTSGCGCATPIVRPEVIEPGGTGVVEVKARPLTIGDRTVHFVVHSDSILTPEVVLSLKMSGSRRPPYLLAVKGELTFRGDNFGKASRILEAITVEGEGQPTQPLVECGLPFIHIKRRDIHERPYVVPRTVMRTYSYEVTITPGSMEDGFEGEARVIDPWDPDHVQTATIIGQPSPALVTVPRRLVVRPEVVAHEDSDEMEFEVKARQPMSDLRLEVKDKDRAAIEVDRVDEVHGSRSAKCRIRMKPGTTGTTRPLEQIDLSATNGGRVAHCRLLVLIKRGDEAGGGSRP